MGHPDLHTEQAYLDRAYERLEAVRAETQARLTEAFRERGGTFQSYTERDIRVRNSLNRLEKLQLGREALIFGRIDGPKPAGSAAGAGDGKGAEPAEESFHIGRLALSDAQHEPLVVDWRAPVAEPFYRATAAYPMGLRRRRHFLSEGRQLIDVEDEVFAPGSPDGVAESLGLPGSVVLRAALARPHTGRMRDIVATVQAEQDEVIRAPLSGALVVQGGPGTGKTAVALHRAAYLLYTYRFPLEAQGVLVVGPNPTFLRYIDQVLPSLGETGVELSTASGLYGRVQLGAPEEAGAARLKGDPRMVQVLRRAVRHRQRALRKRVDIPYGRALLTLSPETSEEIVSAVRRRSGAHNARRRLMEAMLWQHLVSQLDNRAAGTGPTGSGPTGSGPTGSGPTGSGPTGSGPTGSGPTGSGPTGPGASGRSGGSGEDVTSPGRVRPAELGAVLRRRPEVVELLERMWPRLTAEDFLHDLFGARPLIALAGHGVLTPDEVDLLYRPRSVSSGEVTWAQADVALLDEAAWLLGPVSRRAAGERRQRTYGHIVVDEAQDLSPMELRMVGRRSLSGSMTLVGDVAQATGPWAPSSWDDVMTNLPVRRGWRHVNLSVSYRAPAEVMALAAPVLGAALPGTVPPEPVRHTGQRPRLVPLPSEPGAWSAGVARTVSEELGAVASTTLGEDGSLGVLVPAELLSEVRAALMAGGVAFGEVGAGALDAQVSLLGIGDAKGLEFDAVVVVEPARIVATPPQGLRGLYVALTRCTRRLAIVAREPLPVPLRLGLQEVGLGDGAT
jgi:DNA helicase IV